MIEVIFIVCFLNLILSFATAISLSRLLNGYKKHRKPALSRAELEKIRLLDQEQLQKEMNSTKI